MRHLVKRLGIGLAVAALFAAAGCASPERRTGPADPAHAVPGIWPVSSAVGHISSGFGYRSDPRRFRNKERFHSGVDIAAPQGTPVAATAYGEVVFAGRNRDAFGRQVIIDHGNGYRTRYAHLGAIETKRGRRVRRGDVIGRVGKSGRATGVHLHYEVQIDGRPVDPRDYMP
ncbi:MAG: M23 family metallopeptidase [Candidatus Hydrogenedentes bacterium]|nr:M23 family metallopeptidase [Candidatus Hydrogenedentota bacterium]